MENKKIGVLLEYADDNDGYVSVGEAKRLGIASTYLQMAQEEGLFKKEAKGLYLKRGYPSDPYYVIHFTYKKAVFSLKSALRLQKMMEEKEGDMHLYLPFNYMTKGIEGCSSRHVGNKEFFLGQSLAITNKGSLVPTYSKERCFIDVLRYPELFEDEEYISLLSNAHAWGLDKTLLKEYASSFHIEKTLEVVSKAFGV